MLSCSATAPSRQVSSDASRELTAQGGHSRGCGAPAEPPQYQCFFGHFTSRRLKRQRIMVRWRGVPYDSQVCDTCLLLAKREFHHPGMDVVWLASAPPPSQPGRLVGPCFYGHTFSSAQGRAGTQTWRCLPPGLLWNDTPAIATLCNSCYARALRLGHYPSAASDTNVIPPSRPPQL